MQKLLHHRKKSILLAFLFTLGFASFIPQLQLDTSLTTIFPKDDPELKFYSEIENTFGHNEDVVAVVKADNSLLNDQNFKILGELTEIFKNQENIVSSGVISVYSTIKFTEKTMGIPMETESRESFAKGNLLIAEKVITEDLKATVIMGPIVAEIKNSNEKLSALIQELKEKIHNLNQAHPNVDIYLSGQPLVKSEILQTMQADMNRLLPIAMILVILLIYFVFGSLKATLIPFFVTLFSIAWTFSLKAAIGSPITITESTIPVILISICCADSIHVITEIFNHLRQGKNPKQAIIESIQKLKKPIILTSITTSLGFLSLITSGGQGIQNMGIFLAFGVFSALILTLLFIPPFMSLFHFKIGDNSRSKLTNQLDGLVEKSTRFFIYFRYPILVFVLFLLLISCWAVTKVDANTDEIRFFKPDAPVRVMAEKIEKDLWGLSVVYVILYAKNEDGVYSKEVVNKVRNIQKKINELRNVSYSLSFVDFIDELGQYVNIDESKNNKQIIYSMKDFDITQGQLTQYVTPDGKKANLRVRLKDSNTERIEELVEQLEPILKELPAEMSYRFAGDISRKRFGEVIVQGQIRSLILSLISIFVVVSIVFRSVTGGIMITLPVSIAILFNFTVMWLCNVTLNPATAVIASVGMGVGVDYSIHYFSRYKQVLATGLSVEQSVIEAVKQVYQAISINAFAVGVGFTVLTLSSYQIIFDMGWIITLTMVTTAVFSLAIIPVLIVIFHLIGLGPKPVATK